MPKSLVFTFGDAQIALDLAKVDRSDLYGYVDTEALDDKGRKCSMATLADDGKTLVGSGGTAFASLAPDGSWLERGKLVPIDPDGKRITPVPSSFNAPIPLVQTATIDEYLAHNVRSVYQLTPQADLAPLMAELQKGTIFTFPYSYRGGLEPDAGFLLLGADGGLFLAVATPTRIEFVGFAQAAALTEEESPDDEESEELDFSMM